MSTEKSHKATHDDDENLEDFYSDEEHENFDSQKEDMKQYLNNLNKRIDTLVNTLKQADAMMARMGDQKGILEQIQIKKSKAKKQGIVSDRKSIAEFFKEQIANAKK